MNTAEIEIDVPTAAAVNYDTDDVDSTDSSKPRVVRQTAIRMNLLSSAINVELNRIIQEHVQAQQREAYLNYLDQMQKHFAEIQQQRQQAQESGEGLPAAVADAFQLIEDEAKVNGAMPDFATARERVFVALGSDATVPPVIGVLEELVLGDEGATLVAGDGGELAPNMQSVTRTDVGPDAPIVYVDAPAPADSVTIHSPERAG